jgi:aspartate kinase
VPHAEAVQATELINGLKGEVGAGGCGYDHDIGRVSVIGAGMKSNPGVAAKMFQVLADHDINIEMISTSAIRISCIIAESKVEKAVELLHAAFELDA